MNVMLEDAAVAQWEWAGEQPEIGDQGWGYDDIRTVVDRVNRGAQLLDEQEPGWREKIIPDRLQMKSAEFCIIGQVYGNYDEYVGVPFGMGQTIKGTARKAVDHGFLTDVHSSAEDTHESIPYSLLDAVWVAMISARATTGKRVFLDVPERLPRNRMLALMSEMVE